MHAVTVRIRGEQELLGLMFKHKESAGIVFKEIEQAMLDQKPCVNVTSDFQQTYCLKTSEIVHVVYRDQDAELKLADMLVEQQKAQQRKAALRDIN